MNITPELQYAALSVLPALALLLSDPVRRWPAAVFLAVSVAAGGTAVMGAGIDAFPLAVAASLWSILGTFAVMGLSRRDALAREENARKVEAIGERQLKASQELAKISEEAGRTEREQKESLALYNMIKGLSEALSWEDIKPRLDTAVAQYLGVTQFALYIYVPEGEGSFQPLSVKHLDGLGASWATIGRYLQEHRLTPAQAHIIESPESAVALPVNDNTELLGYFYARVPQGVDARALLAKAQTLASDMSFAFRRVKLFQEVERLSRIDGLTGVYRRGTFDDRLREELVRAKTFKTTVGLMLLDIDHFKELNDRYGHPFGDQVLKALGELLNASVYETDFVARYGGEEFVIILPRAQPEGALRKAETIRKAIEEEKFPLAFETVRTSVSIGIAHFPRDASSVEELIAQADAAMYFAKSQGRNRVVDCLMLRPKA